MPSSDSYFKAGRAKTGGRQKGTPNKATVLENKIMSGVEKVEIENYVVELSQKYPTLFVRLIEKLLPAKVNVGGQEDNELIIKIKGLGSGD